MDNSDITPNNRLHRKSSSCWNPYYRVLNDLITRTCGGFLDPEILVFNDLQKGFHHQVFTKNRKIIVICMCMHTCICMFALRDILVSHLIPKISYFENKNQLYLTELRLPGHAALTNRVCELSKRNQGLCGDN